MDGYIFFLIVTASAVATGAMFQPGTFYEELTKPDWNPPAWLFAPIWTTLYIMIAIAGWLIWRKQGVTIVLGVWALQLAFNAFWSFLAFKMNRLDLAFYDIAALWTIIVLFIILAWPVSRLGAVLFVPYLIWVSFAGALNYTLWRMNPVVGGEWSQTSLFRINDHLGALADILVITTLYSGNPELSTAAENNSFRSGASRPMLTNFPTRNPAPTQEDDLRLPGVTRLGHRWHGWQRV